jgi:hypothetical protein
MNSLKANNHWGKNFKTRKPVGLRGFNGIEFPMAIPATKIVWQKCHFPLPSNREHGHARRVRLNSVDLVVDSKQTAGQEEYPRNTLRFSVKYSEFPIYDINPFLVEY